MANEGSKTVSFPSQWASLLQNLGQWQGSFTRLTPAGEVQEDIPTLVSLEGLSNNQTVRLTIQYFAPDSEPGPDRTVTQEKVLEYSSLNRSILFFENGAFSQGSIQLAPFSEFGAELGLIHESRRLRLVQLFNQDGQLNQITLIREKLAGTDGAGPPLRLEALLGEWQGEAVTLFPDGRLPTISSTTLCLQRQGNQVVQHLTSDTLNFSSIAKIDGSILRFGQDSQVVQVLLLPNGASCTSPLAVKVGQPLFLELGWLEQPNLRQRLLRSYNAKGEWVSLTLVKEHKVA